MYVLFYLSFPNSSILTGNMTEKQLVVSATSSQPHHPVPLGARSVPVASAVSVGR